MQSRLHSLQGRPTPMEGHTGRTGSPTMSSPTPPQKHAVTRAGSLSCFRCWGIAPSPGAFCSR